MICFFLHVHAFATEEYQPPKSSAPAFCTISPDIKILLSIPQDRDYEKKYNTEYEEVFRDQCNQWVVMDVYVQNTIGIWKLSVITDSTFPACTQLLPEIWWFWRTEGLPRRNLVSGSFYDKPLVINTDFSIHQKYWDFSGTGVSSSTLKLPECKPNIRLKK